MHQLPVCAHHRHDSAGPAVRRKSPPPPASGARRPLGPAPVREPLSTGSIMKIYIFVDMEGISGVSGSEFVTATGAHYQTGRRYYTEELNVCAKACFEAGATEVVARDGHGAGNHFFWDGVDPRVQIVQGQTGAIRMWGLPGSDALILLGYHAMAGTRGALLEHTYSSATVQNMWLNGRPVGEAGLDAAIAADYGVPTILATGDDFLCREAREWIPGVHTCEVKKACGCQGAMLLPRQAAHDLLREATLAAVRDLKNIKPLDLSKPVTIRRELVERQQLPATAGRSDLNIIDGRTYEKTAPTVEQAFFV